MLLSHLLGGSAALPVDEPAALVEVGAGRLRTIDWGLARFELVPLPDERTRLVQLTTELGRTRIIRDLISGRRLRPPSSREQAVQTYGARGAGEPAEPAA